MQPLLCVSKEIPANNCKRPGRENACKRKHGAIKHSVRIQDSREDKHIPVPTGSLSSLTLSIL